MLKKQDHPLAARGLLVVAVIILQGCTSLGTLHTPEVLEPGQVIMAAGATASSAPAVEVETAEGNLRERDLPFSYIDALVRVGVHPRAEVGLRLSGFGTGLGLEGKMRLSDSPLLVAGVAGANIGFGSVCLFRCADHYSSAMYAGLVAGTKNVYAGVKLTDYLYRKRESEDGDLIERYRKLLPSTSLGLTGRLGRWGLVVEGNTYFIPDPVMVVTGGLLIYIK